MINISKIFNFKKIFKKEKNYSELEKELQKLKQENLEQKTERELLEQINHFKKMNAIEKPDNEQIRFIKNIVYKVQHNFLVLANDTHRYRSLYYDYTDYFKAARLPDDCRNKNCARKIKEEVDISLII